MDYSIEVDRERRMLRIRFVGVWTITSMDEFAQARRRTLTEEGWGKGDYVCLVDLREHGVQPRDVADHGIKSNVGAAVNAPRKTALVVSSMLKKLQVARALTRGDEQVFMSEEEALRWLDEDAGGGA
jgi:hypothetical protein